MLYDILEASILRQAWLLQGKEHLCRMSTKQPHRVQSASQRMSLPFSMAPPVPTALSLYSKVGANWEGVPSRANRPCGPAKLATSDLATIWSFTSSIFLSW